MKTPTIMATTTSDEASAIAVVVLAFGADPAARWTWPDPQQYLMHFPNFVKVLGGSALAYLESSNPNNIPLYERHGFELLGTIQAGASPPIFPMLCKPR